MREIKFRAWYKNEWTFNHKQNMEYLSFEDICDSGVDDVNSFHWMQYTGLKDKNGMGLTEVYEGDIISEDGTLKGNIYEDNKEPTDIVIPQLGTKAWDDAYKKAMERGYDYSE